MGAQQFLYVAAVVLLIIAALTSWAWRPDWNASYGHTAGWAGLACYVAAGLAAEVRVRDDREIEVPIPRARRVVAAVVLLMAGAMMVGWLPVTEATFGIALLLVAVGLMI